jgi:hypothetical protein
MKNLSKTLLIAALGLLLAGCATPPNYIVLSSGTTLGFDVSESAATASPQATLAYKRVELAVVPTSTNYTPDAMMEFRFESGMFTKNVIYSRVATGPNATTQVPAALMMSKDRNGTGLTNINNLIPLLTAPKPTK